MFSYKYVLFNGGLDRARIARRIVLVLITRMVYLLQDIFTPDKIIFCRHLLHKYDKVVIISF
jgi:hypothetical protein